MYLHVARLLSSRTLNIFPSQNTERHRLFFFLKNCAGTVT